MSEEPPIPDQTSESVASTPEALFDVNSYLHDPSALRTLIVQPSLITERLRAEGGENFDALATDGQLLQIRQDVLTSIIGPEGLVKLSKDSAERIKSESDEVIGLAKRLLEEAGTEISNGNNNLNSLADPLVSAKTASNNLQLMLNGQSPFDLDTARLYLNKLRDFQKAYSRAERDLRASYDAGASKVRSAANVSEQGAMSASQTHRNVINEGNQASAYPEKLYFGEIESAVANRAASSVEEHRALCESEKSKYDQFSSSMIKGFEQVSQHLIPLKQRLNSQQTLDSLPVANRLGDTIEYLSTTLFRLNEHGSMLSRRALEDHDRLTTMLNQIEQSVNTVKASGEDDLRDINASKDELYRLRQALQEV